MGSAASILEINGKRYDAVTGKLLGSPEPAASATPQPAPAPAQTTRTAAPKPPVIDGFRRSKPQTIGSKATKHHRQTASVAHSKIQDSKTLMRKAVTKPQPKAQLTTVTPVVGAPATNTANFASTRQVLLGSADRSRLQRAKIAPKHNNVKRFATSDMHQVTAAPQVTSGEIVSHAPKSHHATASVQALPSSIASATHGHLEQLVNSALASANSHEGRRGGRSVKNMSRRSAWLTVGAICSIVVLLGAFFAYQNVPNVAMRLAARQAGVAASVPTYKPAGFSFDGPISYANGLVTLHYVANGDSDRSFVITQRKSSWDSQSLLSNYVLAENKQYQTYQDQGKTIYIYDDSNATWVDGGVWYNVAGKANLNSDQLLHIASSM